MLGLPPADNLQGQPQLQRTFSQGPQRLLSKHENAQLFELIVHENE